MTGERRRVVPNADAVAIATTGVPGPAPDDGLLARLARALPRRRRIVVARAARAPGLEAALRSQSGRADVRFVDLDRVDGHLLEEVRLAAPDEVYIDLGAGLDEQTLTRIGARLLMDGTTVHFVFPETGRPRVRAAASRIGPDGVVSLHAMSDGLAGRVARRVLDVVGVLVLLVVLAPLAVAVAALVWWKTGRPVLHAQERLGRGGRRFTLWKFRSMVADAEARLYARADTVARYRELNFKLPADEDDRITPLGRVLRRTSLDELPQLWNVLRGDMSLVGPRAIVPEELAEYGEYGRMLLRVKPGLTGLWQVSGRSTIGYPERALLDLGYVEGRTLVQDLEILLRTLPAVIRQRGAL